MSGQTVSKRLFKAQFLFWLLLATGLEAKAAAQTNDGITLSAPQYAMVSVPISVNLAAPAGVTVTSAQWNFGDGSAVQSGVGPLNFTYFDVGAKTLSVSLMDSLGHQITLSQTVNVIPYNESYLCVANLSMSYPAQAQVGQAQNFSDSLPPCISVNVASIQWTFGDGLAGASGQAVTHTYAAPGSFTATSTITMNNGDHFVLNGVVTVTTTDPTVCTTQGATQQVAGSTEGDQASCGVGGTETDTYQNYATQTCEMQNGVLHWVTTSTSKQLVSKGQCMGQSCELPAGAMTGVGAIAAGLQLINGNYYALDGNSMTFYSSQSPAGACKDVSEVRKCSNGTWSGDSNYVFLLCKNGCPGVGPDGSTATVTVSGTTQVPKSCNDGSTVYDTYSKVADETCNNGVTSMSNVRQGSLISAGTCPIQTMVYSWVATGSYGTCSAACGGTQTALYVCKSSDGVTVDASKCSGQPPVVTRVCDADPASVARIASSTTTENSVGQCGSGQIGMVSEHRSVTTTIVYECTNHQITSTTSTSTGDWVVDSSYCVDFQGLSCKKEKLNDKQAAGRYDWLKKCDAQLPVAHNFMTHLANVKVNVGGQTYGFGDKGRVLYPTFAYKVAACDCSDHDDDRDGDRDHGWFEGEWEHSDHGRHLGECTAQDRDDVSKHHTCSHHHKERSCKQVMITRYWHAPVESHSVCKAPSSAFVSGVCLSSGKGGHECGDRDDDDRDDHHGDRDDGHHHDDDHGESHGDSHHGGR